MDKNWIKKKKLINTSRFGNNTAALYSPNSVEQEKDNKSPDIKEAEKQIQNFIILRAWRNGREKNKKLETEIKNLSNQVENLQLQTYALRQLLDAEKARVMQSNNDLKKVLNALEESKCDKKLLVNEKEQLENRLQAMEEQLILMENECKNKKNELFTARLEAQNWEKQLEKEREKLCRLKDEKKFLIDEVRFNGNMLVWQIRSFEQFSRLYSILQGKPNNPALPWDDTFGRNDPASEISKLVKTPKKQQTIIIVEKEPEKPELKALPAKAEKKTTEEDEKNEELEKSILGKTDKSGVI